MRCFGFWWLLCLLVAESSFADDLTVSSFSPLGVVSDVKQVRISFNQDMIALGAADQAAPAESNCVVKGQGSWIDTKTWTLNVLDPVPSGTNCTFSIKSGLKSIKGAAYKGDASFSFSVRSSALKRVYPYEGATIHEDQAFLLVLDDPVEANSVLEHAFFRVEGIKNTVGLKFIEGAAKEKVIKASYLNSKEMASDKLVVVPRTNFAPGSKVEFVWGVGVRSKNGTVNDIEKVFAYKLRDPFRVSISCTRDNPDKLCNPFGSISVSFNSPVSFRDLSKIVIKNKAGSVVHLTWSTYQIEAGIFDSIDIPRPYAPGDEFSISIDKSLRDRDNRPLSNVERLPIKVGVDDYPPIAKFSAEFGVIEYTKETNVPITVRNMEADIPYKDGVISGSPGGIIATLKNWFTRITGYELSMDKNFAQVIKHYRDFERAKYSRERYVKPFFDPKDKNFIVSDEKIPKSEHPKELEVIGIPIKKPGFHVLEVRSERLGQSLLDPKKEGSTMYVPGAYMVSNIGAHLKLGRENSLVWATTLSDAKPLPKAKVSVYACDGTKLWSGYANKDGVARVEEDLTEKAKDHSCREKNSDSEGYADEESFRFARGDWAIYAFVQKAGDFSFVSSDWNEGIEPWRWSFETPYAITYPYRAHAILDRSLLRAGETLHLKNILRRDATMGFSKPDASKFTHLYIRHNGTGDEVNFPLKWDDQFQAVNEWQIPKSSKLGSYSILIGGAPKAKKSEYDYSPKFEIATGYFEVQEFRVPLTKGYLKVPTKDLVGVKDFPIDFGVQYLAGDGVSKLPIKLSINRRFQRQYIDGDEFTKYEFDLGKPVAEERDQQIDPKENFGEVPLSLDDSGNASHTIKVPDSEHSVMFNIELSYMDPNGEMRSFSNSKSVAPKRWHIGAKAASWSVKDQTPDVTAILIDENKKALPGKNIRMRLFKVERLSHRKKLAGGVYGYETEQKLIDLGEFCSATTAKDGTVSCKKKIAETGNFWMDIVAKDAVGRDIHTKVSLWVMGGAEQVWFDQDESDRMDLIPVKQEYEAGAQADFQVRMPFATATALVTTEREGILDYEVIQLDSKNPIYSMKVKANQAPNVYVSMLALRGRIDTERPTAMVDLGKPAFKLGSAMIKVNWKNNRLLVDVKPERSVYKVREKAKVHIKVRTADGSALPSGSNVTIAAVDLGLLSLKNNQSWNILDMMMLQRPSAVGTFTAQMQIIGKRHFGLKARNPGGDGAAMKSALDNGLGSSGNPRELFDTLLSWQAVVKLDGNGEADVEIPLNDSLTAFRVAAIASGGLNLFGDGHADFQTTKDLILYSGIAPVIRIGDKAQAKINLRNTTKDAMSVRVKVFQKEQNKALYDADVKIAPKQSQDVYVPIEADDKFSELTYEVSAKSGTDTLDSMISKQKVLELVPVRTQQSVFTQLTEPLSIPVKLPEQALPHKGDVKVSAQASVVTGLEGIREFAKFYPYSCLEQRLSKAVMLEDKASFDAIAAELDTYMAPSGLLRYFPSSGESPQLSAYFLQISSAMDWSIDAAKRDRILAGLLEFAEGRSNVPDLKTQMYTFQRLTAIEALSRYKEARPQLLDSIVIDINSWPTSNVIDLMNIVHRLPDFDKKKELIQNTKSVVQARLVFSGSKISFDQEDRERVPWLMSSADLSSIKLIASALEFSLWKDEVGKYARGAFARMERGAWDLTTANAFGVATMRKLAKISEAKPVSGKTSVQLAEVSKEMSWKDQKASPVSLAWPNGPGELKIEQKGSGAPWVLVQTQAAIQRKTAFGAGASVEKTLYGLNGANLKALKVGDMVKVKLVMRFQTPQDWVVIDDPIPAGSTILGKGLGGEAQVIANRDSSVGSEWAAYPAYVEDGSDSMRAYFDHVSSGSFNYEYNIRINNAGNFAMPVTHVEAMYAPEIFAETPNETMVVAR